MKAIILISMIFFVSCKRSDPIKDLNPIFYFNANDYQVGDTLPGGAIIVIDSIDQGKQIEFKGNSYFKIKIKDNQ